MTTRGRSHYLHLLIGLFLLSLVPGVYSACAINPDPNGHVDIPNSPEDFETVPDGIFKDCKELKSVTIPDGVYSIGNSSFSGCSSLTTVTFLSVPKLTSIGEYAFYDTDILTINLPSTLTTIHNNAFRSCVNLATVNWGCNTNSIIVAADAFTGTSYKTAGQSTDPSCRTVLFTPSCADAEASPSGHVDIPYGFLGIQSGLFSNCLSLKSVYIPSSVIAIGKLAFFRTSALTQVTFEGGSEMTTIQMQAFQYSALSNMIFPPKIIVIEDFAFSTISTLIGVTFTSGCANTVTLGQGAFELTGMTSLSLPSAATCNLCGIDIVPICSTVNSPTLIPSLSPSSTAQPSHGGGNGKTNNVVDADDSDISGNSAIIIGGIMAGLGVILPVMYYFFVYSPEEAKYNAEKSTNVEDRTIRNKKQSLSNRDMEMGTASFDGTMNPMATPQKSPTSRLNGRPPSKQGGRGPPPRGPPKAPGK